MDLPSTASGMPSETSNSASAAKHVHASDEASLDMLSTSSATAAVTRKPETDTARLRSSACIVRWRMVALRGATVVGGKCPYVKLTANAIEGSSANVSPFCFASTKNDDEPSPAEHRGLHRAGSGRRLR